MCLRCAMIVLIIIGEMMWLGKVWLFYPGQVCGERFRCKTKILCLELACSLPTLFAVDFPTLFALSFLLVYTSYTFIFAVTSP